VLRGAAAGELGETPLHVAVLLYKKGASNQIVDWMWHNCPSLRTAIYDQAQYEGENVRAPMAPCRANAFHAVL